MGAGGSQTKRMRGAWPACVLLVSGAAADLLSPPRPQSGFLPTVRKTLERRLHLREQRLANSVAPLCIAKVPYSAIKRTMKIPIGNHQM